MSYPRSSALFERAQRFLPGGVDSPVRAFRSVGMGPLFIARGEGPHVIDADGNRYLDFVGSWGPLILGHAPAAVVSAITEAAATGTSFGATTEREIQLAELVTSIVPSVELVRFVSSGTEATMSALRVARGFTGRERVIKFSGCYHGHADAFLADAGSGVATLGIPGSAGVPVGAAKDTITVPFNDLDRLREVMNREGSSVAAVILEPIACNIGLVMPAPGFLQGLRELCTQHGALLIFDEVITGFRVALGGAQNLFNITPDLSTFGKVIGGGLPVGAYGGRREVMEKVAPLGPVYQAGTLSGNPLAMAAGIATLEALRQPGVYEGLEARGARLQAGLEAVLARHGALARVGRQGSIFHLWFKAGATSAPRNYDDMKAADAARFAEFFRRALAEGVYLAPSAFEVGFISTAHTDTHIDEAVAAIDRALS